MAVHPLAKLVEQAEFPTPVRTAVEAAALEHKTLWDYMSCSPYLTEQTWRALYTTKPLPPVRRATNLVSVRALSPTEVDHASMHDDRSSVLAAIMRIYGFTPEAQERLATGKGLGTYTIDLLYTSPWATESARRAVAFRAHGRAMLYWLASTTPDELSAEEGCEIVSDWPNWSLTCTGQINTVARAVYDVLERRPEFLVPAAELNPTTVWVQATANSRHLTTPVAMKLLDNARVHGTRVKGQGGDRARHESLTVIHGLLTNPLSDKDVVSKAIELANELIAAIDPAFTRRYNARLDQAMRIRRRIDKLASKVGSRSALAPRADSFDNGAICVDWATTDDQAVLKLLAGLRGNPLDDYNTAALAHNPNLGDQAHRIGKRVCKNWWYQYHERCPLVATSLQAFTDNFPEVAEAYKATRRRYWIPPEHAPVTEDVAVVYDEEYVRPGGGYAFPISEINSYMNTPEVLAGIAEHMVSRLGNDATAWSLVFSLADQFTNNDIDTLIDACLKLTS